MNLSHIAAIMKKDFNIEIRQRYAIAGIFLFAVTTAYFIYKAFNNLNPLEWNVLVWIIVMFAGLNAIVKSFVQERKETYLYYYSLFGPLEVIVAKLIYNFFFTVFLTVVIILTFTVLFGNPIKEYGLFFNGTLLGILGISSIFTFVSSVSGAGSSNGTMMSILSIPLVLPNVLLMEKITAVAMRSISDTAVGEDLTMLASIDLLIVGMIILIFPTLWKA